MTQYGFFVDLSRCIGCNACVIACKQWHDISPGPVKWMRVYQWETEAFPNVRLHRLPIMCLHCEKPVCAKVCPNQAIHKEIKYGAVLVDKVKCQGTRKCWQACPYGAPQFAGDEQNLPMSKCNMCIDRLEEGLAPICVMSCSMRALEFGPINELREKYGSLSQIGNMPRGSITRPAVIFKPTDSKKEIVQWDYNRALELWQKRHPDNNDNLPDIFTNKTDVTQPPENIGGRNRLVLKAKNTEELMYYTTDDE